MSKIVHFILTNYLDRPNASPEKDAKSSTAEFANFPRFLLSFPSPQNSFKPELQDAMKKQRQQAMAKMYQTQVMGTIQEEEKDFASAAAQDREPVNEPAPILQAKTLDDFLKVAFD